MHNNNLFRYDQLSLQSAKLLGVSYGQTTHIIVATHMYKHKVYNALYCTATVHVPSLRKYINNEYQSVIITCDWLKCV